MRKLARKRRNHGQFKLTRQPLRLDLGLFEVVAIFHQLCTQARMVAFFSNELPRGARTVTATPWRRVANGIDWL